MLIAHKEQRGTNLKDFRIQLRVQLPQGPVFRVGVEAEDNSVDFHSAKSFFTRYQFVRIRPLIATANRKRGCSWNTALNHPKNLSSSWINSRK